MSQEEKISLRSKQKELLQSFFEIAEVDENGDYCVPLYTNEGDLTLFKKDTHSYQYFGYLRIMRLIKKGIFFIKVKKVKRNRKFLCIKSETIDYVKLLLES
uniref:Uncharacterized protein n=1 Tax=Sulfolobus islandicus rod-shaped virus 1 TaxID=157898 RepID=Q5W339_SIRV1|nr:hypothetical protein [Sulfolobus islandicus rod-shaped virus 1]CAG28294.1 hypothetical protein [Sulfolobus islandicus rod-shaped virus 1]